MHCVRLGSSFSVVFLCVPLSSDVCFDEADSCYSISEDVPLALCYDPRQVITLAGKRYLSGAVIFVRYDTDGNFVALTTSDLYLIQCYLGENSVPLMAGREKMVCICID